jgi:hypothetical protein
MSFYRDTWHTAAAEHGFSRSGQPTTLEDASASRARLAFPPAHASTLPISTVRVPQVGCLAEVRCMDAFRGGNRQRNLWKCLTLGQVHYSGYKHRFFQIASLLDAQMISHPSEILCGQSGCANGVDNLLSVLSIECGSSTIHRINAHPS